MLPQVVIDTNVIFAALYSQFGASNRLLRRVGAGSFDFHLSLPLILEYEDVLKRNAPELLLDDERIDLLLAQWCLDGVAHEIFFKWRPFLRDPKDDLVLEVALAGNCTHIVTHNLRDFQQALTIGVEPITPIQFLELIGD